MDTELIKWWDALDALTGREGVCDVAKGLELARESKHPDAVWLTSLFPRGAPDEMTMQRVMEAQGDDPRALFFASQDGPHLSDGRLQRGAEMGYAPAQAALGARGRVAVEAYEWTRKAAAQGDRFGIMRLGLCLWNETGCEQDRAEAVVLWSEAAALGECRAMFLLGVSVYSKRDLPRYRWLGKAAQRGLDAAVWELQERAARDLRKFESGNSDSGRMVFEIGAALEGLAPEVLVADTDHTKYRQAALQCVELHEKWNAAAIAAIECWIAVGLRLGVVKDIRLLIAKMLSKNRYAWIKH
jgi:TPR repeat protein